MILFVFYGSMCARVCVCVWVFMPSRRNTETPTFCTILFLSLLCGFWPLFGNEWALTSFRWWLMKNDRNLCWCFACLYLRSMQLFKLLLLSARNSHIRWICRTIIVVLVRHRFFSLLLFRTLLLNSFPSFIIFPFLSVLLRVDLLFCSVLSISVAIISFSESCQSARNFRSPVCYIALCIARFTFYAWLFCRVYLDAEIFIQFWISRWNAFLVLVLFFISTLVWSHSERFNE